MFSGFVNAARKRKKNRKSCVKLTGRSLLFYITGGHRFWTFRFGQPSSAPELVSRAHILGKVRFVNYDSNEPKKLKICQPWTHLGPRTDVQFWGKPRFSWFLAYKSGQKRPTDIKISRFLNFGSIDTKNLKFCQLQHYI